MQQGLCRAEQGSLGAECGKGSVCAGQRVSNINTARLIQRRRGQTPDSQDRPACTWTIVHSGKRIDKSMQFAEQHFLHSSLCRRSSLYQGRQVLQVAPLPISSYLQRVEHLAVPLLVQCLLPGPVHCLSMLQHLLCICQDTTAILKPSQHLPVQLLKGSLPRSCLCSTLALQACTSTYDAHSMFA